MVAVGTVRIFWSGGEDDFCAAKIGTLLAIEDRCGSGVGAIYQRIINGDWKVYDVSEVIRLALIGAGMSAEDAKKKTDVHVLQNPNGLAPSLLVSMKILEAALVGVQDDPVGKPEAEGGMGSPSSAKMEAEGSTDQPSTDFVPSSNGRQEPLTN
jgi:hypothetical protein